MGRVFVLLALLAPAVLIMSIYATETAKEALRVNVFIDSTNCNVTLPDTQRAIVDRRLGEELQTFGLFGASFCGCNVTRAVCYKDGVVRKARFCFLYSFSTAPTEWVDIHIYRSRSTLYVVKWEKKGQINYERVSTPLLYEQK